MQATDIKPTKSEATKIFVLFILVIPKLLIMILLHRTSAVIRQVYTMPVLLSEIKGECRDYCCQKKQADTISVFRYRDRHRVLQYRVQPA